MPVKGHSNTLNMDIPEKIIRRAQKYLRNLGSKIQITGKTSIGMTTALYTFQRKHNLPETGELDVYTWRELKRQNNPVRRLFRRLHH